MFIVRAAVPEDEEGIFKLARQFPTPTPPSQKNFSDCYRIRVVDPASYIGLAEMEDAVVGYVSGYSHTAFYANGRTAWLDEIFVEQAFRRKGVGAALLHAFERWAKQMDCVLVSLATAGSGPFYIRAGYRTSAAYYKKYFTESIHLQPSGG